MMKLITNELKRILPIFVCVLALSMPAIVQAQMKGLTMTMKETNKSVKVKCPAAIVQGGAMIGGDGITYTIKYYNTNVHQYETIRKGSCASNTSFPKYDLYSRTGWSENLMLSEYQKNTSNPGIGWGRIDY